MLPDQVSSPGPLTYESGALPIALRNPSVGYQIIYLYNTTTLVMSSSHLACDESREPVDCPYVYLPYRATSLQRQVVDI